MGSYKVLCFASAMGLNRFSTERLWCEHLVDVLTHPDEITKHQNIRSFQKGGWAAVKLPSADFIAINQHKEQVPVPRWMCNTSRLPAAAAAVAVLDASLSQFTPIPTFRICWYSPTMEVDLCGHATLGSAAALVRYLRQPIKDIPMNVAFETRKKGTLIVRPCCIGSSYQCDWEGCGFELDFPEDIPEERSKDISIDNVSIMLNNLPKEEILYIGHGVYDTLVEITNEASLVNLVPNLQAIKTLLPSSTRGIIVTCASSSSPIDFKSRMFGPAVGIDEDPVTGSAHCTLAVYWSKKLGKKTMEAEQVSKRGGKLQVIWLDHTKRVLIRGEAAMSWRGALDNS